MMERYERQIKLAEFGNEGQEILKSSKVLVIGAGGLGIPVLTYLNAMGVGTLGIVDSDTVSLSNLHRQVLFDESDVNRPKVTVAAQKLRKQNSDTNIIEYLSFINRDNALELISAYDLIIDASDNFPTRYLVNDASVILDKPFIYGALHGFEGQVSVFNYLNGPTYRCLYPKMPKADEVPDCNEHGVLGILPGIIGSFQALEAVKVLTGIGEVLSGKLLLFDSLSQNTQKIKFKLREENKLISELKGSYDFDCEIGLREISGEDFIIKTLDNDLQLIDVRTKKEFERNHLQMAQNVPLGEIEGRINEIDSNRPVYVICQSGIRSKKAISKLSGILRNAEFVNVNGGMNQIPQHAS
tara:strand:- start:219343 stop:220407 length:1065 start_codon:yes stop_codon:yes gene_type:complete